MKPSTICPIFAKKDDSFFKELNIIDQSECDLIEIRLDPLVRDDSNWFLFFKEIIELVHKPVIATIRTDREGGEVSLKPEEYCSCIELLFTVDRILVDVELPFIAYFKDIDAYRSRMILSKHYFNSTPNNLKDVWNTMEKYHPYIQKIACMPQSEDDVARLLISCYDHKTDSKKIAISMSKKGSISRIAGFVFGSCFTFTTISQSSAPGQIPLEKMNDIMDLLVE